MSHLTRVKTQMTDRKFLLQALQDLGYTPQEGNLEIRGYQGYRVSAEIRITPSKSSYDIGFTKVGDTYEMIADWWGIHNIDQTQLTQQLLQRYAYNVTLAKLEEQGFTLAHEEVEEGQRIHLMLRRIV